MAPKKRKKNVGNNLAEYNEARRQVKEPDACHDCRRTTSGEELHAQDDMRLAYKVGEWGMASIYTQKSMVLRRQWPERISIPGTTVRKGVVCLECWVRRHCDLSKIGTCSKQARREITARYVAVSQPARLANYVSKSTEAERIFLQQVLPGELRSRWMKMFQYYQSKVGERVTRDVGPVDVFGRVGTLSSLWQVCEELPETQCVKCRMMLFPEEAHLVPVGKLNLGGVFGSGV
jgi:hypothetical protein